MDYIFTEFFFNFLNNFVSVETYVNSMFESFLIQLSDTLPVLVRYTIGYCHFYYQLGYGFVFYIYLYRRRKAKKNNNWQTFYGNSILNWAIFNFSIFNKFIFNRNFIVYLKAKVTKAFAVLVFWFKSSTTNNLFLTKLYNLSILFFKKMTLQQWTPIFKRTSYISFMTLLKRFTKRK